MTKAINRFYEYLDFKGIKPTRFEKDFGLSNGYLGTQLKRGGSLGEDVLKTILDSCEDLNPSWLISGKGEMLINTNLADNIRIMLQPESEKTGYLMMENTLKDDIIRGKDEIISGLKREINLLNSKLKGIKHQ